MAGFGDLVAQLGGNPRQVMERAGLDAGVLNRPDEWISFRSVLVAYELAAVATGRGDFGIQLSGHRDLSFLGPIVLIFKYSRDLEHGLSSCVNYMRAHNTGYAPVLEVGRDTASWQFQMDDRLRAHATQWIEESLLTAMKVPRFFLGEAYLPEAVYCRHARREGTDYEKSYGTVVKFGAPFDGIITRSALFSAAMACPVRWSGLPVPIPISSSVIMAVSHEKRGRPKTCRAYNN